MIPRIVRVTETNRIEVRGPGGGRNGELLFNGDRVSVWDERVLETDAGDGDDTRCE